VKRALLIAMLLAAGCATAPKPLPYDALIATTPHAVWGVLIEDESGRAIYAHNADKLLITASNRKLFASATAATCLGFDARFATELWRDGDDVVLRGGGDPSLGSDRHARENALAPLVDALAARGVTSVRDVIADVSFYDRITIPGAWKYGNLGSNYAAPVDALAWRENAVGDDSVADPPLAAATALREALILRGITVTGAARVNTQPKTWQERVAVTESPYLYQLLTTVLKNSHNLYAEMLLKDAGGGTYAEAFAKEQRLLRDEVGISADETHFVDGSGLAPDNLATPQAIVKMLRWINAPERRGVWWTLMATPGESGTLRRRLPGLETRLRAKTGTVFGVNALSGIIRGEHGGYRYFSVIVNHNAGDADAAVRQIDAIVQEASRF
jgi:D-alanyl-D-alanine carboxypeptidase/D-alanyl-D-alanine-endopeptidase (penicillin-binding protein 4)